MRSCSCHCTPWRSSQVTALRLHLALQLVLHYRVQHPLQQRGRNERRCSEARAHFTGGLVAGAALRRDARVARRTADAGHLVWAHHQPLPAHHLRAVADAEGRAGCGHHAPRALVRDGQAARPTGRPGPQRRQPRVAGAAVIQRRAALHGPKPADRARLAWCRSTALTRISTHVAGDGRSRRRRAERASRADARGVAAVLPWVSEWRRARACAEVPGRSDAQKGQISREPCQGKAPWRRWSGKSCAWRAHVTRWADEGRPH